MKIKNFLTNSSLVLLSVLITVGLLEFGMRTFQPVGVPFDVARPEEWNFLRNGVYTPPLNSLGFREEELSESWFEPNVKRVLFLGDSFTFGHGVENGDALFPSLVEGRLNSTLEDDVVYHFYNSGRPGTEPRRWFTYFNELLPVYQPDTVVAVFFLRDGTELCTSLWCYEEQIEEIKSQYMNRWLYKNSHIARLWFNTQIANDFSSFYANEMINSYLGDGEETAVWEEQQDYLLQIRDLATAEELDFHIVIFPVLYDLNNDYPFAEIDEEIIRFANDNQIPVYPLTDGFMGHNAVDLWVSSSDQHPNEAGHQIAADTLYPYMLEILSGTQ